MSIAGEVYSVQPQSDVVGEFDTDDLMEALADYRRRETLRVLWDADGAISLPDLADEITRRERASAFDMLSDSESVETALHHVHLPKLADSGLVVVAETDECTRVAFTGTPDTRSLLSSLLTLEET